MEPIYFRAVGSEWAKKKRSLAAGIVLAGGSFTPVVILIARLVHYRQLPAIYRAPRFWENLWTSSWESMAIFLLPLGAILACSLVTQLEYRNNTWKLWHTLPLPYTTVFFSKLTVILVMLAQFIALFTIGVALAGILPWFFVTDISFPRLAVSVSAYLRQDLAYFCCCLPVVAVQYLLGLFFRNFLVPVGVGFILWVGALSVLSWPYNFWIPYSYVPLHYLSGVGNTRIAAPAVSLEALSLMWFAVLIAVGYTSYRYKPEKG